MKVPFFVILIAAGQTLGAPPSPTGIGRIAWLQGCWKSASEERTIDEQWMAPLAGSMLGMSRTVRSDRLVAYEWMLVREEGDRLVYDALPSDQAPAKFVSRSMGEQEIVFENPKHGFPQQVGYRRAGATLVAWVEGTQQGEHRRVDFPYRRAACPGE
jgi:Domain of unknown function (DUF6265)